MESIAHIRSSDKQIQTVEEHLHGVRKLAESLGEKLGIRHIAGLAGVLHDMGKYTGAFKEYILQAVSNPDAPPKRGSVDHSTAGGKLLYDLFHRENINPSKGCLAEIVGNAIISHHAYLQDFLGPNLESAYLNRVREKDLPEFSATKESFFTYVMNEAEFQVYVEAATKELTAFLSQGAPEHINQRMMFLTKFVFSILIDADRTNTRLFEENQEYESPCESKELFESYYNRLMEKVRSFQDGEHAEHPIHVLRAAMSEQCDRFAEKPSGIYTLSIPTGGGKTLASLRYALRHAMLYQKKRIIYVVPYTTIIEQNAAEVRNILLDEEHILEHHSNVIEDTYDDDEEQDGIMTVQQKLKLAKDNWDSPIIFTTMVQFLNVFYANGSRNIRRLHNLSGSVIIFDEIQKVPIPCISLFNRALNFLKNDAKCSLILCTATQPALEFVESKLEVEQDAEMIKDLDQVIDAFKRVEIVDCATDETFNTEKLAAFVQSKIEEVQSVLVILNTKSVVRRLYSYLLECGMDIPVYHLSTSMCASHRNDILHQVRGHLERGEQVICISTQLIEAGVDVSFECVIRSLAGLDSIAQAAGRCNRHGEKEIQYVYIIDHEEEKLNRLREIQAGKRVTKRILLDMQQDSTLYNGHMLSQQAMGKYFREYYTEFAADLNYFVPKLKKDMTELLTSSRGSSTYSKAYQQKTGQLPPLFITHSYKTAAESFRVIKEQTTSVVVPYGAGKDMIAELNGAATIAELTQLLRKVQQYTINVFQFELDLLAQNKGLVSCLDGEMFVLTEGAYDRQFGLNVEGDSQFDVSVY